MKVKAHLTQQQPEARGQLHLWHGNDAADAAAKNMADLALPPRAWFEAFDAEEAARARLYRAAAKILTSYPRPASMAEPGKWREVEKADQTTLLLMKGHEVVWVQHRQMWVCLLCSASCSISRRDTFLRQACRESSSAVARCSAGAIAGGHRPRFAFVQDGPHCVLCPVRLLRRGKRHRPGPPVPPPGRDP